MHPIISVAQCALVLEALYSICTASPVASRYISHEQRSSFGPISARSLHTRSKLSGYDILPIRIGLTQSDLDAGHDWVMDVAHPESPNYGKHWSAADVNAAFAPSAKSVSAVRDWLISAGINAEEISLSDNKGWLAFDATVEEAEVLFQAKYYEHEHHHVDKYTVGCDS